MSQGFTTEIEILRATWVEDRYSSSGGRWSWEDPEVTPVEFPVSVQPMTSSEGPPERPTLITSWQMITPPGRDLPLDSKSRIRVASGDEYSVDGDVHRFPHPTIINGVHHLEVQLQRVKD